MCDPTIPPMTFTMTQEEYQKAFHDGFVEGRKGQRKRVKCDRCKGKGRCFQIMLVMDCDLCDGAGYRWIEGLE